MKMVLVIRTGTSDTWQEKLAGLTAWARSVGWALQFVDARGVHPDISQLIASYRPIGAIVDASGWLPPRLGSIFGRTPFVLLHPRNPQAFSSHPCVISDPDAIAQLAARELLSRSVQSVAFIDWHEDVSWATTKREAFRKVIALYGMKLHVITPERDANTNQAEFGQQIAETLEKLSRPCGVFAIFDFIGALAVSALTRCGCKIPSDYSIVSVDNDTAICESCFPTLSSIKPDFFRIGFTAGHLLAQRIEHQRLANRTVKIPPLHLVRRTSSHLTGRIDFAVFRALDYIRVNACAGLSPRDIQPFFGRTTIRSAELRFKAATGKSIASEILDVRLSRACEYLRTRATTVQAVADFCGWKSTFAFRKAFHSRFGLSPQQWAKTNNALP